MAMCAWQLTRRDVAHRDQTSCSALFLRPLSGAPNTYVDVTVQDLPGLSMSVCLAMLDTTGDAVAAREAMASTLLRFPVVLEPLLEK